ncbi:hypothetical protein HJC23_007134 [Cyclotella cryptica]|uniref:Uncharacterized protein n=1 Tax=Cyclotella cryptica TaxID=29204 RepID=A0ABD3QQ29_9STRA
MSRIFLRSALVTQTSLSATSLLCSVVGKSQLPSSPDPAGPISHRVTSALPWIDELHNIISFMYSGRGASCRGMKNSVMVQMHQNATFENPLICFSGIREIERAFRLRTELNIRYDRKTLLECIHVEASEDSILAGGCKQNHPGSHCPPTVQVVYRLQQTYGSLLSLSSMVKVTVQVQSSDQCRTKIIHLPERAKTAVIATSGLAKNVLGTNGTSGLKCVLARDGWRNWLSDRKFAMDSHTEYSLPDSRDESFVAEVVKIEECWNEVELLSSKPFHWSRRINGLLLGILTHVFSL